jgi:hypothetical protein
VSKIRDIAGEVVCYSSPRLRANDPHDEAERVDNNTSFDSSEDHEMCLVEFGMYYMRLNAFCQNAAPHDIFTYTLTHKT